MALGFRPKPQGCSGCSLEHKGLGFVPPEGPLDARLMVVGQGPGEQEALHSRPFVEVAPSGRMLTERLYRAGLQRTDLVIHNLIQCWKPEGYRNGVHPYGSEDPTLAEARECQSRHPVIPSLPNLRWIVPIGTPSAKWFLGVPWDESVERWIGSITEHEEPSGGVR